MTADENCKREFGEYNQSSQGLLHTCHNNQTNLGQLDLLFPLLSSSSCQATGFLFLVQKIRTVFVLLQNMYLHGPQPEVGGQVEHHQGDEGQESWAIVIR